MKTIQFIALCTFCFVSSCVPNEQKPSPPYQPVLPYEPAKIADNTSHPGYSVYTKNCHKCHQQAHPISLTKEKWAMTVPAMAKHAGISEEEGKMVLDYILHVRSDGMR